MTWNELESCLLFCSFFATQLCMREGVWMLALSLSFSIYIYIYAAGDEHARLWVKARILEANKKLLVFVPYEENNRVCLFPWCCGTTVS